MQPPAPRSLSLAHRAGRRLAAALLALVALLVPLPGAAAQAAAAGATDAGAPFKLRVVGGLAGITQYTQLEAPFWTRDLPRLSGGRFTADIVPFDRAGVPGSEMLRLLHLGVVPFGTVLMSSLSAQHPFYTAADLPGLNPDMAALRATLAAVRPALEQALRSEQGIEPLALYVYPAQVLFCRERLRGLADLRGRVVRVSSAAQGDFMAALGAKPRLVPFAQMVAGVESGALDCAVTAAMSGNVLGLHQHTAYLYPMPITWGLALFGANQAAWQALPQELRTLLRAQLPRLETAIWLSAEEETANGLACNTGSSRCTSGRRGAMTLVPVSAQDEARRAELLRSAVLPRWRERCGARCAGLQLGGPGAGSPAPGKP
ncbi:TRAP transporter substrate-binding protein [Pulveribacter suum]|uniref:ABC transporter substrate-binding protein n=1 Tax=Pulveribacter suum TaxID=2116657 RepID=A0A2P1NJB3_9BURK|nr:TRAP transporter substrate-binding protein [Pulveribacter suum]AVP57123.1 ABC transporter substrate-binding protein [Pulveribacter suum]